MNVSYGRIRRKREEKRERKSELFFSKEEKYESSQKECP